MVSYGNSNIPIIIIPKGTLLFRVLETGDTGDFKGVQNCIPPQYNVFFYYSPFVVDGIPEWYAHIPNMEVYVTAQDLKIVSLISPSKFTRTTRTKKKQFMVSCHKTRKSCLVGREYDPCFRDSFLEKNPTIMGWTALGRKDVKQFKDSIKNGLLGDRLPYVHFVSDDRKITGPPELAIYPLQKRYLTDITPPENKELFNYIPIATISRKGDGLKDFLLQHAEKVTGKWYYKYKE
jgi:hypothetical protein